LFCLHFIKVKTDEIKIEIGKIFFIVNGNFNKDKYIKIEIKLSLVLKLIFSLARLYISIKSIRKIRNKKINKTIKIFFKYILIKYEKSIFGNIL
jgi:hypothetical protein